MASGDIFGALRLTEWRFCKALGLQTFVLGTIRSKFAIWDAPMTFIELFEPKKDGFRHKSCFLYVSGMLVISIIKSHKSRGAVVWQPI